MISAISINAATIIGGYVLARLYVPQDDNIERILLLVVNVLSLLALIIILFCGTMINTVYNILYIECNTLIICA